MSTLTPSAGPPQSYRLRIIWHSLCLRQQYAAEALFCGRPSGCPPSVVHSLTHTLCATISLYLVEMKLATAGKVFRSEVKVMIRGNHTEAWISRVCIEAHLFVLLQFLKTLGSVKTNALLGYYTKLQVSQYITNLLTFTALCYPLVIILITYAVCIHIYIYWDQ